MNVTYYLNDGWKPDSNSLESNYCLVIINNEVVVRYNIKALLGIPIFKSEELAKKAIEILGEETIKIALS